VLARLWWGNYSVFNRRTTEGLDSDNFDYSFFAGLCGVRSNLDGGFVDRVNWMRFALISMAFVIVAGAFGAHGLASIVSAENLVTWGVAVRYQAWVSLIVFGLSAAPIICSVWVFRLLALGMCIFSGSLYALVLMDWSLLGAITPIGGVLIIGGLVFASASLTRESVR